LSPNMIDIEYRTNWINRENRSHRSYMINWIDRENMIDMGI